MTSLGQPKATPSTDVGTKTATALGPGKTSARTDGRAETVTTLDWSKALTSTNASTEATLTETAGARSARGQTSRCKTGPPLHHAATAGTLRESRVRQKKQDQQTGEHLYLLHVISFRTCHW